MSKAHYTHLRLEERAVIQVMLDHKCSLRAIARKLCRSPSTISREFSRNSGLVIDAASGPNPGRPRIAGGYRCAKAQQRALGSGDRNLARGFIA